MRGEQSSSESDPWSKRAREREGGWAGQGRAGRAPHLAEHLFALGQVLLGLAQDSLLVPARTERKGTKEGGEEEG